MSKPATSTPTTPPPEKKEDPSPAPKPTVQGPIKFQPVEDPDGTQPDFIYWGPFIKKPITPPFIETALPMGIQQSGIFSKSYAHFALKERMPVIITKVIDTLSKKGDAKVAIEGISKMKHDLMTNKDYDPFIVDSSKIDDAEFLEQSVEWNKWIHVVDQKKYYNNAWVWTECYIYRKMKEQFMLSSSLKTFDPFEEEKNKSFADNLEPMCIIAEKLVNTMLDPEKPRDERKADFQLLVKLCLFANKCDLAQSLGEPAPLGVVGPAGPPPIVSGKGKKAKKAPPPPPPPPPPAEGGEAPPEEEKLVDPIQMILSNKDKFLTDDSGKAFEQINNKVTKVRTYLENPTTNFPCTCNKLAAAAGLTVHGPLKPPKTKGKKGAAPPPPPPAEGEEVEKPAPPPPPPPCPARLNKPSCVMYDIICDNAGYELFTDMCFATYLVEHKLADKIRFHVKNMPWFVSDATTKDIDYLISSCKNATYSRTIANKDPVPEGEEAPPPRVITADQLKILAGKWEKWIADGVFKIYAEWFWTSPHIFREMKKYDYWLYRKMQMSVGAMYKGDLNYRKLVGEFRTNPQQKLDATLQGYNPCSALVVRTIKSEVVCGLPKGKWNALTNQDPEWMRKGYFGVIHFSGKAEKFKVADRPCIYYGDKCMGVVCPDNPEFRGADPPKAEEGAAAAPAEGAPAAAAPAAAAPAAPAAAAPAAAPAKT